MVNNSALRQAIIQQFDNNEIRLLCADLRVDYEVLLGETKDGKAQGLIDFLDRRGRLLDLTKLCGELRPNFDWQKLIQADLSESTLSPSQISVECADVVEFPCDVLILKFAQAYFGADAYVTDLLEKSPRPKPNDYEIFSSEGKLEAKKVMFVGVISLFKFGYSEIRAFADFALRAIAQELKNSASIAMTMHGVGYGLDEREAFLSQVAGLVQAFTDSKVRSQIRQVTIVEKNYGRAMRLRQLLQDNLPSQLSVNPKAEIRVETYNNLSTLENAGINSMSKPHIFVAMPFNEQTEDVYSFGIQEPVNSAGFLCERVDMVSFTGDILSQIKSRIETARLVVADLSGANPNVYLEVGYAWGRNRPTLLVVS